MHQENGQAGFNLGPQVRVTLSGTKVGELLQWVELPPPEYSRCEVAAILLQWANPGQWRSDPFSLSLSPRDPDIINVPLFPVLIDE